MHTCSFGVFADRRRATIKEQNMATDYEHLFVRHMGNCADDRVNEGAAAGLPNPENVGEALALMRASDVLPARFQPCRSALPLQCVVAQPGLLVRRKRAAQRDRIGPEAGASR